MRDLSIIIVNYNTKDLVLACLKSIKEEGSQITKEVIVVDNASSDGSKEAFEKVKEKEVKFIFNKTNDGYAKANNQALKMARGKYLLLLNSDTVVKKGALRALVSFAKNHPEAGVIGSRLFNADGSLQPSCYYFPTLKRAFLAYFGGHQELFEKYAPKGEKAVAVEALVGASFLITPQAREKVGFLDERYWAYFEDLDYCREVKREGLKVYYLPASEIIHYHGASFKKAFTEESTRWRKLIPSSKIYHGVLGHYLINAVLWLGQKWQRLLKS